MFEINIRDAFTDKNYNVDIDAADAQEQLEKIRKKCVEDFGAEDIIVNIEDVHDMVTETWDAKLIREYMRLIDSNTYEAVLAWLDYILPYGRGVKNALEHFPRCYMGIYSSIKTAAEDYFFHEYSGTVEPYWLENCLDYDKLANILVQDEILLPIYDNPYNPELGSVIVFYKIDNWEE